ncbi:MAG TPA: outer membrane protein assembly factor BamD [Acidobacteriaceae bacterium]|nr:outer membrane protein assembly factor BamD [Acidobacteriaceae bacterium]
MKIRSFFPSNQKGLLAGLAVAALLAGTTALNAQDATPPAPAGQTTPATQTSAPPAQADVTLSNTPVKKKKPKIAKSERVQATKDTKAEQKKEAKFNPLIGKDQQLPDKQLYDKAVAQIASGHYDIGRLDLQTLLDTYPDSQYMMRAKLAVADAWYKEGGSAALTEAEQEYRDFITFFPNVPEAAEAQLRIGDIYFKQMDVPDRDYSKATHAEAEYRTMLKQYPDAPKQILDDARQKLREVQEVLADREAELGAFYATHANWPASIARYQTVVDTYPLYSHMDDVLIGIGDAYEAEATAVRAEVVCTKNLPAGTRCLPEGAKGRLLEDYDNKAADDYRRVVLYHSAAPHVEDAKERLTGMNLPIPTPTKEQEALSEELESSRAQYNLQKRIELVFLREPDTVTAARTGLPTLQDPTPTTAPVVVKELMADYRDAFNPNPGAKQPVAGAATPAPDAGGETSAATPAPAAAAPPSLEDVPSEGAGAAADNADKTVTVVEPGETRPASGSGTGIGAEIITPGSEAPATGTGASNLPAATGAQDPNFGLPMPKAANTALPAVEKAPDAPDQVNEAEGHATAPGAPPPATQANGKKKKTKAPKEDKNDESSSKKKPKKGLDKLNPF